VPHKLLAVGMVDALDASGREWGAVNTVRFEGKDEKGDWRPLHHFAERPAEVRSQGFNTDADAITKSLREDLGTEVKGKSVLLLGAGGAGRTAALKLAAEGVGKLFLVNRTESRAIELRDEIAKRFRGIQTFLGYPNANHRVDLMLNATSLGLKEADPLPLDSKRFPIDHAAAVYDMIYRPAQTGLLQSAKAAGCRACNGVGMLLYQGAAALEIWSGKPSPIEIMRQALLKNIYPEC
jgi:shikimate dehydrogenase